MRRVVFVLGALLVLALLAVLLRERRAVRSVARQTSGGASALPERDLGGDLRIDAVDSPERTRVAEDSASAEAGAPQAPSIHAQPSGELTLELTIERDGLLHAGVGVWIADAWGWPLVEALDVHARAPTEARHGVSGTAGDVVFEGLPQTRFTVGLNPHADATEPDRFSTSEYHAGHRYTIAIGSAVLFGVVYGPDGEALSGVGVQVMNAHRDKYHTTIGAHTLTNERGEYELEFLAAGDHVAVVDVDGRFDGRGDDVRRRNVRLDAGETRQLDFGSPEGLLRWDGRLLNAFGEPFPGTGHLRARETTSDERARFDVDAEGRFEIRVRPGTWRLHARVSGSPSSGFDLGEFALETDREEDLIVRGIRLGGRLTPPDKVEGDPSKHRWTTVSVRPEGHDYPAAFRRVNVDAEGRYAIDGLEPGWWLVGIWPGQLAEGPTVEVLLEPGDEEVVLDLRR